MPKRPSRVEGVDYSPEGIEALRQELIKFRDEAMKQGAWGPVATLSHTIALLAYLVEIETLLGMSDLVPRAGLSNDSDAIRRSRLEN